MNRAGARLLLGLVAFVLVGWGVVELLLSVLASADLNAGAHYPSDVAAGVLLSTGWVLHVSHCLRQQEVQ